MKNIPSVKVQERITQSRLLYPSAMRPEQTTPLERPKQTAPFERRAPSAERPFFQSKQTFGGSIPTRPPPSWKKKLCFSRGGGGAYSPGNFPIKKTKKVKKKIFFFQKNASKAVKNLYTKKWPKFFYNESDSKMVKNLCTKKWLKIFLA